MTICPNCKSEIQGDFGLITCSNCGAQVILSIDGLSELAPSGDMAVSNLQNALVQEVQNDVMSQEPMVENLTDMSFETAPPPPPPLDERPVSGIRLVPADISPQEKPLPATPDMSEVADFGNSPASMAREGSLRFNIFLSGIDTVAIRKEVQEALTDERFLWDAEALMAKAKNGELKISDVSAVKSSLIIQRLRPIPIDIRWEQYAIHQ